MNVETVAKWCSKAISYTFVAVATLRFVLRKKSLTCVLIECFVLRSVFATSFSRMLLLAARLFPVKLFSVGV